MPRYSLRRLFLVATLFAIGFAVLIKGFYLETQNPRSNEEDHVAWAVLAIGASLIGAGTGMLFRCTITQTIALAIAFPPIGFALFCSLFWG